MSFGEIWNEITENSINMAQQSPFARFICCPNSHPFQERNVPLSEPVKIGRSVARCRNSPSNAVFDCKVLSRNHALLWFDDNKFYLQDTKSSNGTFVNNQRLSKASEESSPLEVASGDVVQFGVDVMDSQRKATHGCIFAEIRLFLPGGEESKRSTNKWSKSVVDAPNSTVQSEDLYQLHRYLQEALHREQMLEQKLALLQRAVLSSHEASERGWQALIDEDKLLSRLEFLENQLQTLSESKSDESLQTTLQQIQEEKFNYENTSKETLRQALQEKLEAVQKLANLERSLSNTEDECTHLRASQEQTQLELSAVASEHRVKVEEVQRLTAKLQESERLRDELRAEQEATKAEQEATKTDLEAAKIDLEAARAEQEETKLEVERKLSEVRSEEEARIRALEGDNERLQRLCENAEKENKVSEVDLLENLLEDSEKLKNFINSGDLKENLKEKLTEILHLQNKMEASKELIGDGGIEVEAVKAELSAAQVEAIESVNEVAQLRQRLEHDETASQLDGATERLREDLRATSEELARREGTSRALREELAAMEERVKILEAEKREEGEMREKVAGEKREVEEELSRFSEERERQSLMLTQTNKELQAALLARENLLEREETLRKEVESSEKILKTFGNPGAGSESEDGGEDPGPMYVVMKAKLAELKGQLQSCEEQLQASNKENSQLRDQIIVTTNEQIVKMENQEKEKVASTAETQKLQTQILDLSSELAEVKGQLTLSQNDLAEVKGQQVKVNLELDESQKRICEFEEKIQNLEGELSAEREKSLEIPRLEKELMTSSMTSQERALECDDLQCQLSAVQGQLEEVKQEIFSLQDKLLEEQESASKHSRECRDLRSRLEERDSRIAQLEAALGELERKEEIISNLNSQIEDFRRQNESLTSDFGIVTQSLRLAEKERGELGEEMRRAEEERRRSKEEIEEQLERNRTLHDRSSEDLKKFELVLGSKDDEIAEVTSRCQQLIREREAKAATSSMRRPFLLGFLAALISYLLYYILY